MVDRIVNREGPQVWVEDSVVEIEKALATIFEELLLKTNRGSERRNSAFKFRATSSTAKYSFC